MSPDPVDALLDDMFSAMHDAGLSQAQLARRLGCSEKHVSQVFNGKSGASLAFLRKMWTEIEAAKVE